MEGKSDEKQRKGEMRMTQLKRREAPEKAGSYHDGGEDLLDIDATSSGTLGALASTHASHKIGQNRRQLGAPCPIR